MENYKRKAIELIMGLAVSEKKNPSVIPYTPAKTAASESEKKTLRRLLGGKKRKYSKTLLSLLSELEYERRANIHNIMIVKDGAVICEASHPGYDVNTFHLSHSMSKTVTAIAFGILSDEGRISKDERIADIFPEVPYSDKRFADMTLEHLLTMRSGVPFAEAGTVTEDKWTETFFASELSFAPGESFSYNSMNSYILAKAICRITKSNLCDIIYEKLFAPLGIENYLWELSPEGTEKGGFGLYLSAESYAKIGIMLLGGGIYDGKRILSEEFVREMTRAHSVTEEGKSGFNYGYHIWTDKSSKGFLLNGMLGQDVYISPEQGVVVSLNSGNNELFSDSPTLEIIKKYIPSLKDGAYSTKEEYKALKKKIRTFFERRHIIRPKEKKTSLLSFLHLKNPTPFDENWQPLLGTYAFPDNNAGILPAFVSVFQNNYIGGIEKIALERRKDELVLTSTEGGIAYEIPVGIYDFAKSVIDFKGEKYIVRAIGEAMEDENRVPVYKIELIFPELPNSRLIKITHAPEGIRVRMSETPNQNVAVKFISSFLEGSKFSFAFGIFEKKMGEDFISKKLASLFNPELFGTDTAIEGWENIIALKNSELAEKREGENKFVKSIISKFTAEEKPEKKKDEEPKQAGFLAKAISSLFSKFAAPLANEEEKRE